MNFINRAFKNATRSPSKSILLTLTFFLIGNLVIVGLGVASASESAKILTRQKMRAVVTYDLDYNKIWQYGDAIEDEDEREKFYMNFPKISLSDVEFMLADDRVKTANALTTDIWYQDPQKTTDFVHLNNDTEAESGGSEISCYIEDGTEVCENRQLPAFAVRGNMFPSMIEIEDGDFRIVSGRFYNEAEINEGALVCVISQNLAETNGLDIGDSISISVFNYDSHMKEMGISEEDCAQTFEVIGIFDHNSPLTPDSPNFRYAMPYENLDNMILMPTTTTYMATLPLTQKRFDYELSQGSEYLEEQNRPEEDNMMDNVYIQNVIFLLSDPLDVERFVDDYDNDLPQFASLDANNEEFNKLSKPLDTLSMYAEFIIWLVVINAVVIITLVTALTLKTREYEIGVLLSIGASKIKVILQFFLELALVAILGFSLSVISGSLIAKKIGNIVLEQQIMTSGVQEEEDPYYVSYNSIFNTDYTTDITLDDLVNEYEVTISPLIIAEIYIMGLGIVLISVIIPSFMIMRYNPKKILMNTN